MNEIYAAREGYRSVYGVRKTWKELERRRRRRTRSAAPISGLPLLGIVALFFASARRSRPRLAVALGLGATVIASLGASIRVAGFGLVPGPWKVPAALPVTRTILPVRLTVLVALAVAMIAALWIAERRDRRVLSWGLVVLGSVFLLPNRSTKRWSSDVPNPRFFAKGFSERHLRSGDNVLIFPYGAAVWGRLAPHDAPGPPPVSEVTGAGTTTESRRLSS